MPTMDNILPLSAPGKVLSLLHQDLLPSNPLVAQDPQKLPVCPVGGDFHLVWSVISVLIQ